MLDLLEEIAQADEIAIEMILQKARERYCILFPDRELNIFALQKDSDKRKQLDQIIAMLQAFKPDQQPAKNRKVN